MSNYFGKIESVGRDEEGNVLVHFDVAYFSKQKIEFNLKSQLMQIHSRIPKNTFKEISKYSNFRERWFQFKLQRSGLFRGDSAIGSGLLSHQLLTAGDSVGVRFNLEPVPREITFSLNKALRYELTTRSAVSPDQLEIFNLAKDSQLKIAMVRVLNVGQGSANCGLASASLAPIFYFDVGGGIFQNRHTYRQIRHFQSETFTTIFLSHWDMDHFFSALHPLNEDLLKRNWVAPCPVPSRPTHVMLALTIHQSGTLSLWPTIGQMPVNLYGGIVIGRANGTARNRNASGIVMNVPIRCENGSHRILLTGDAEYHYIPAAIRNDVDAVVVPHHGGRMRGHVLRSSRGDKHSAHVFSYGRGNSYGHPVVSVVTSHQNAGWGTRYDTPKGDVEFGCFDGAWHRQVT